MLSSSRSVTDLSPSNSAPISFFSGFRSPLLLVDAEHLVDLLAHAGAGPAQVGFEDLPDVHARRHAERVEHDVDGVPSSRYGMSSIGTMRETTPLLP